MVLVYLTGGECTEVEAAAHARVENGRLLCFDRRGIVVATFKATEVQTFTNDPDLAEAIADEACEDVVTVRDIGPRPPVTS